MAEPPSTPPSTTAPAPSTPPPSTPDLPTPSTPPLTNSPAATPQPKASPIRPNTLFNSIYFGAIQNLLAKARREGKRISMYGKTCIVEYDYFMKKYIPAPADKPEPENLSTWTGTKPIKPENSRDNGVNNINAWLEGADNDDNRNEAGPGDDGYMVVVTANKVDPLDDTRQRCDFALYPKSSAPTEKEEGANWAAIEVLFECKPEPVIDDPFDENAEKAEPTSDRRRDNLGQIMSYATLMFTNQHRAHLFTVVLFGDMARIIRWDRSGVVVTKKFNYQEEPAKLGRFLWRFCHLSASQRGHDPSVTRVLSKTEEDKLMEDRASNPILDSGHEIGRDARKFFQKSIKSKIDRYKITVDGRDFLVGRPHFTSSELAGRGTRCYVALDCNNPEGPFVYLKDAWRVAHDGIEREGDILAYLNDDTIGDGRVEGVPTLVCHGDVGDQQTVSQEVWKELHPGEQYCPLKTHRHYRIVVEEVCLPMSRFRNAAELAYLICLCIIAHGEAYKKGVMHRDVSAGNVLICVTERVVDGQLVQDRRGLLTDWELSKRTDTLTTARQPNRTGTWQFLPVYILDHPNELVCVADEIEAFFHVMLYYAIRYLRHNITDVGDFMHGYFDGFERGNGEYCCGAKKRAAVHHGIIVLAGSEQLIFTLPPGFTPPLSADSSSPSTTHILNALIAGLLRLISARYTLHLLSKSRPPTRVNPIQAPITPSAPLLGKFPRLGNYLKGRQPRSAEVPPQLTPDQRVELEAMAAELGSHDDIVDLFASFLMGDQVSQWPQQDTVTDQLPKDYRPKNDAPEEACTKSRLATGSKRSMIEDEGEREVSDAKRRSLRSSGKTQAE